MLVASATATATAMLRMINNGVTRWTRSSSGVTSQRRFCSNKLFIAAAAASRSCLSSSSSSSRDDENDEDVVQLIAEDGLRSCRSSRSTVAQPAAHSLA